MQSSVGKWGNSLAVRLPIECARASGLSEGAAVEVEVTAQGEIRIVPVQAFDKAAFLKRIKALHRGEPSTTNIVAEMRRAARY